MENLINLLIINLLIIASYIKFRFLLIFIVTVKFILDVLITSFIFYFECRNNYAHVFF